MKYKFETIQPKAIAVIDYTNYEGKRTTRRIFPRRIYFGSSQWHPEPQWLLQARDLDKNKNRTFAMRDIHSWNVFILPPPKDDTPPS